MNCLKLKPSEDPHFDKLKIGPVNSPIKCDVLLYRLNHKDTEKTDQTIVLTRNNIDFLVFSNGRLSEVIDKLRLKPGEDGLINLIIWAYAYRNGSFVFAANDIGMEGEWYLLGGYDEVNGPARCMARDSERDLTKYLISHDVF